MKNWNVMKDIIRKSKIKSTNLQGKLTINKVDVYNKPQIWGALRTLNVPVSAIS